MVQLYQYFKYVQFRQDVEQFTNTMIHQAMAEPRAYLCKIILVD